MTSITSLYNSLPSVEEANEKFVDRTQLFSKLAPLLAAYQYKFGVCLVHAHCKLEEGEVMVASGHVSEPQNDPQCYPERWLASGEAYEFTKEPTVSPPPELFTEFRQIVGGTDILGLYAASGGLSSEILQERTVGRKNITRVVSEIGPRDIETGWLPGSATDPITMVCLNVCIPGGPEGHQQIHMDKPDDAE